MKCIPLLFLAVGCNIVAGVLFDSFADRLQFGLGLSIALFSMAELLKQR